MKPIFIEARDPDDCWFQLLSALYQCGRRYDITSRSYGGGPVLPSTSCLGSFITRIRRRS
jgi:hypothetical protein